MLKIREFFRNKENAILLFISLILAVNSLFFVAQNIQKKSYLTINDHSSLFFLVYFIASVAFAGTIMFFSQKFELKKIIKKILWTYLATEIILLYGIEKILCSKDNFTCLALENLMPAVTVVYFILVGYLIVASRKKEISSGLAGNFRLWIKKQGWLAISILFLAFILNLSFGTYHLSRMAAVDEALWTFDRIPKYWSNILDGEWHKTRVSDKPGITVALISGAGMIQINPKDYKDIRWQGENSDQQKNILDLNFNLRFPILLFNALMLFVFYFFIERLLGKKTAIFSAVFIGLSPILLGISTIINPDSLLWVFLPLSMLSYLVYRKNGANSYLYWAGIFLGLALLTKYVANILYVFFFLIIFLEYLLNREKYANSPASYLKKSLVDYFILIFFSLLTFLVFLPASWVEISKLLEGTILSQAFQKVWPIFLGIMAFIIIDAILIKGKIMPAILDFISRYRKIVVASIYSIFILSILAVIANTYLGMKWFDFETILASPKSSYLNGGFLDLFGANFYSLVFGIHPLALFALLYLSARNLKSTNIVKPKQSTALYLIIFILLYYFASTVNAVSATVRYQIVIYPIALIIAAFGIVNFISIEKIKRYIPTYLAYLAIIIFSIFTLNSIRPYYFSYASGLLPRQYVLNLKDMGDGSYEAAQYLDRLPDAENLRVWSDKKGVCTFFVGNCSSSIDETKDGEYFDYFVLSSGRESRTSKMVLGRFNGGNDKIIRLDKLYDSQNPEWVLEIGNRPNNFVKIIKNEEVITE
jgi:4-amino-4-deoxy-L-arabinose transferase-like glycosyltransferase